MSAYRQGSMMVDLSRTLHDKRVPLLHRRTVDVLSIFLQRYSRQLDCSQLGLEDNVRRR